MVQTRSDLKRKAMDVHCPPQSAGGEVPSVEEMRIERDFGIKYGGSFIIQRPKYSHLMQGINSLITDGAEEWGFDLKGLGMHCGITRMLALGWTLEYLIPDISVLPEYQIHRLITRADGFCAQMDWAKLRPLLPPTAAAHFGDLMGELLIHLAIHDLFFERPFWYLDGKKGPDDLNEDPEFGKKLQYLFERFYKTNPRYGVLWKMQTQRLANSETCHRAHDLEFGQYNARRHEAALSGFVDNFLASEPFCWLLKDSYPGTSMQADRRRTGLINVFRKGLETMIKCETWTNGQPFLRGIDELGGTWSADSSENKVIHSYAWRPQRDLYNGQRILFVARPGLIYVDSLHCYQFLPRLGVTEVCEAEVIPAYIPGDDESDTADDDEKHGKQDGGDEEWRGEKNV